MRVLNHPEATAELIAAVEWYQEVRAGLGEELLADFERTVSRLSADPERFPTIKNNVRKIRFQRFPYAIMFRIHADSIEIVAVMHLHRRPFYWLGRR
jgi:hypothetical protein